VYVVIIYNDDRAKERLGTLLYSTDLDSQIELNNQVNDSVSLKGIGLIQVRVT
jgi:hypothetical protein